MPRQVLLRRLHGDREPTEYRGMLNLTDLASLRNGVALESNVIS